MSEFISENSTKNLLPIKEASKLVSYSRDYVAKLARDKKIIAQQIDRQWFVDLDSLKSFAFISECEQKIRSQRLSTERRYEQQIKKDLEDLSKVSQKKVHIFSRQANDRFVSVVLMGLFLGFVLANIVPSLGDLDKNDLGANLEYAVNQIFNTEKVSESILDSKSASLKTELVTDTVVSTGQIASDSYQGIVILTASSTDFEAKELFSDPVKVEMFSDTQGRVVVPVDGLEEKNQNGLDFSIVQIPQDRGLTDSEYAF